MAAEVRDTSYGQHDLKAPPPFILQRDEGSAGCEDAVLSAQNISTWNLFVEYEKKRSKLVNNCLYLERSQLRIEGVIRDLGLDYEVLEKLAPEELQKRSDLPGEVKDFFYRAQDVLKSASELHLMWAMLQRRATEYLAGMLGFLTCTGLSSTLLGHDKSA